MFRKLCVLTALFVAHVAMAAVDVNKASAADLDGLSGVGPATTQLILNERKKGEFKNWDDLMKRVKGIGESRASKLSEAGLTVGGASYSKAKEKEKEAGKAVNAPGKASSEKAAAVVAPIMSPAAVVPTAAEKRPSAKSEEKVGEKTQQVKKATEAGAGSR